MAKFISHLQLLSKHSIFEYNFFVSFKKLTRYCYISNNGNIQDCIGKVTKTNKHNTRIYVVVVANNHRRGSKIAAASKVELFVISPRSPSESYVRCSSSDNDSNGGDEIIID